MDVHKNARSLPASRALLVDRVREMRFVVGGGSEGSRTKRARPRRGRRSQVRRDGCHVRAANSAREDVGRRAAGLPCMFRSQLGWRASVRAASVSGSSWAAVRYLYDRRSSRIASSSAIASKSLGRPAAFFEMINVSRSRK